MKRFYAEARVAPLPDGGYAIHLDGRPVRTPKRAMLVLPIANLAEAVAEEWAAQAEEIDPLRMPLLRFSNTAIDRIEPEREQVIDNVAAYGESDLVCYRAPEPEALVARQQALWQPLIDWLRLRHGVALKSTSGVLHLEQDPEALAALRKLVANSSDMGLTGLYEITTITGSLVIALALSECQIDLEAAAAAAWLDEVFQGETWGEDAEALERRNKLRQDLAHAVEFLQKAYPSDPGFSRCCVQR